jgi:hypothetical protein
MNEEDLILFNMELIDKLLNGELPLVDLIPTIDYLNSNPEWKEILEMSIQLRLMSLSKGFHR